MSLENRIAYWVDLGTLSYQETYDMQEKIVQLKNRRTMPDFILATQHPFSIIFGTDNANNRLGHSLEQEAKELGHDINNPEHLANFLTSKNIPFSKTKRGGGASIVSPGQYVFYPIVDLEKLFGNLDVGKYKAAIYQVLFESLKDLGVEELQVGSQQSYTTRKERKDVWIQRNGKSIKLGSKGLSFSRGIAYHGFSLHVEEAGIKDFWMVKPCGYNSQEVEISSVERETGRNPSKQEVHYAVYKSIKKNMSYSEIKPMNIRDFYETIRTKEIEVTT